MALVTYPFEAGPAGNAITKTNANVDQVSIPGGGTATYDTLRETGDFAAKFTNAANAQAIVRALAAAGSTTMSFSVSFRTPTAFPASGFEVTTLRHSTGRAARLQVQPNGDLLLRDAAGANDVTLLAGMGTQTWYRVAGWVIAGGTGTNVSLNVYAGSSNTPINASPITATAYNLGTAAIVAGDFGVVSSPTTSTSVWVDNVQFSNGVTEYLTYYDPVAPEPPTVSAGSDQTVAAGATVNLASTATDPDGSIAARQWTFVSHPGATAPTLTGATSANASFTATNAGTYVLRITVTDDDGLTGSDDVTIYALSTTARPIALTGSTSWTNEGGAADIAAALADDLASTYTQSPNTGTNSFTVRLGPLTPGVALRIDLSAYLDVSGAGNATVELLEGSTVRATWTIAPNTLENLFQLSTNEAQAQAITNWNALDVRVTWEATA